MCLCQLDTEKWKLPEGAHINLIKLGLYIQPEDDATKLARIEFIGDDNKTLVDIKSKSPVKQTIEVKLEGKQRIVAAKI